METTAPTTSASLETPPLVTMQIAITGDTRNFYAIDELAAWVASETQGWKWIPKIRKIDGQLQPVADRYQPIFYRKQ